MAAIQEILGWVLENGGVKPMMDSFQLICLQMGLEGKGLDARRSIIRIPCDNPDTMNRVFAIRHEGRQEILFAASLPDSLRQKLTSLPMDDFFASPQRIQAVLAEDAACEEYFIGKSYIFPVPLKKDLYPQAVSLADADADIVRRYDPQFDPAQRTVFAVIQNGQIVSTCESSRENGFAGEAWVQTLEAYRRRGYARQVVLAWAHDLQRKGKVPFYSHLGSNMASQSLAQSMGLIQFVEAAGYV